MPKFEVTAALYKSYFVEADSEDQAYDLAEELLNKELNRSTTFASSMEFEWDAHINEG